MDYHIITSGLVGTSTFVNVSKHVQFGLDSPLDCVKELHAPDALHLLRDPVKETCTHKDM